jgi:hypothetical protein
MLIRESLTIRAPIERIWDLLDDPAKRKLWTMQDAEVEYLTPVDPQNKLGLRYRLRLRTGDKLSEFTGEVTAWERPHHLAVRLQQQYIDWQYDYRLTATPDGTRFDYSQETIMKVPWLVRALFTPVRLLRNWQLKPAVRRGTEKLKRLAEQGNEA